MKFFNTPGPIQIGTMVAVLEIGAFGMFDVQEDALYTKNSFPSNITCRRKSRRHDRAERNSSHWGCSVYDRRRFSDIHDWLWGNANRSYNQRLWSGTPFVSFSISISYGKT
jgi:hypothetical protein